MYIVYNKSRTRHLMQLGSGQYTRLVQADDLHVYGWCVHYFCDIKWLVDFLYNDYLSYYFHSFSLYTMLN